MNIIVAALVTSLFFVCGPSAEVMPEQFELGLNYPNPFNPSTVIPYELTTSARVRLEVFNLLGQRIATLVDGDRPAGFHTVTWHATDGSGRAVGAGMYIYRMTVGDDSQTGRMVLLDGQAGFMASGMAYPAGKVVKEAGDGERVTIPDYSLRKAVEAALGKARGATITKGDMATLDTLEAKGAGIRDLTGLEFATNLSKAVFDRNDISDLSPLSGLTTLTRLELRHNDISDLSPLSGLTNLTRLYLYRNDISDLSPLSGLTNLTLLYLKLNNISDISPLSGLTKLRWLALGSNHLSDLTPLAGLSNLTWLFLQGNNLSDLTPLVGLTRLTRLELQDNRISNLSPLRRLTRLTRLELMSNIISDVSPLRRLTNLTWLSLWDNSISDIAPLRGLIDLTWLDLRANHLNELSVNNHIYVFKKRGTTVLFDLIRKGDFDIELVFLSTNFTERDKKVIQYAALRWMSILRKDLPDYTLTEGWSGTCGDLSYDIKSGKRIDDLQIYVISSDDDGDFIPRFRGWGGVRGMRDKPQLPFLGCMAFNNLDYNVSVTTALHEIGHVLGIGTFWDRRGFLRDTTGDPHFNGPLAISAFDAAGGRSYTGKKVPVDGDLAHWRASVLEGEVMRAGGSGKHLSAITTYALADLGYVVDFAQADSYSLPGAGKASAKAVAGDPSMPGDDGVPPQKRTCGVGQRHEPIYVFDQYGRVVRTIGP